MRATQHVWLASDGKVSFGEDVPKNGVLAMAAGDETNPDRMRSLGIADADKVIKAASAAGMIEGGNSDDAAPSIRLGTATKDKKARQDRGRSAAEAKGKRPPTRQRPPRKRPPRKTQGKRQVPGQPKRQRIRKRMPTMRRTVRPDRHPTTKMPAPATQVTSLPAMPMLPMLTPNLTMPVAKARVKTKGATSPDRDT